MIDESFVKAIREDVVKPTDHLMPVEAVAHSPFYMSPDGRLVQVPALEPPPVDLLTVDDLEAFSDLVNRNPDGLDLTGAPVDAPEEMAHLTGTFVIRAEERMVKLASGLNRPSLSRRVVYAATTPDFTGNFVERWHGLEEFLIGLRTRFHETPALTELVAVLGHVKSEARIETRDDGMSQDVETFVGIETAEMTEVPSPVTLKPDVTFPDLADDVAEEAFTVRLRSEGKAVKAALFSASGVRRKAENGRKVRDYLRTWIEAEIPIV